MAKRIFTKEELNQLTELLQTSIDRDAYSISIDLEASEANLYLQDKKQGNKTVMWLVFDTNMSIDTFTDQLLRFEVAIARINQNYGVVGHG